MKFIYIINNAGSTLTNLIVRQNGINSALVSWTAPSPPPSMGYRITIDSTDFSAGIDLSSPATSRTILLIPGVHSIRMRTNSQHYPSEIVGPAEVTVKGTLYSCIFSTFHCGTLLYRLPSTNYHIIINNCHISHHYLVPA